MANEIRRDLANRIDERLHLWIKDSVELYRMAELKPHDITVDIFLTLIAALVTASIKLKMPPEALAQSIQEAAEIARKLGIRKYEEESLLSPVTFDPPTGG
jgi:hypothetical protein